VQLLLGCDQPRTACTETSQYFHSDDQPDSSRLYTYRHASTVPGCQARQTSSGTNTCCLQGQLLMNSTSAYHIILCICNYFKFYEANAVVLASLHCRFLFVLQASCSLHQRHASRCHAAVLIGSAGWPTLHATTTRHTSPPAVQQLHVCRRAVVVRSSLAEAVGSGQYTVTKGERPADTASRTSDDVRLMRTYKLRCPARIHSPELPAPHLGGWADDAGAVSHNRSI